MARGPVKMDGRDAAFLLTGVGLIPKVEAEAGLVVSDAVSRVWDGVVVPD